MAKDNYSDIDMEALIETLTERLPKPIPDILDHTFPHQTEFVLDPSKFKAIFATRRSAKSYSGGLAMVKTALEYPGCNCAFIALTRITAKEIIWKDVLYKIDRQFDLGIEFNKSELTATFPNGSVIKLWGVDTDEDEMIKLLGKKHKMVVIDEASMYRIDLRTLIYDIIGPGLNDDDGSCILVGTAGNIAKGFFYDVTTGKEKSWKVFRWTAHENPHYVKQFIKDLEEIKLNRPEYMETPGFKQMYLNQWIVDDALLVYKYVTGRNDYKHLPTLEQDGWSYVLGVDLGTTDSSAFIVGAFHDNDPTLYFVETFKKTGFDATDVADKIKEFKGKYKIHKVVVDGANKMAVVEIQKRHGITLTTADKTGKADFIELMNAEMVTGKIKYGPLCQVQFGNKDKQKTSIIDEYLGLIWNKKKLDFGRKEEHSQCENHLCDAALYAWRFCYQFLATIAKPKVDHKTDKEGWLKDQANQMEQAAIARVKEAELDKKEENFWDVYNASGDPVDYWQSQIEKRRMG